MDGEVHRIENKSIDEFLSYILCFPKTSCSLYEKRLLILKKSGFDYVVETGKNILGYRAIGKGYSSIIVLAHNKFYGYGALKIRRLDSRRSSLGYEGMILDYLDKTLLAPQLYLWSDEFIFMEYLDPQKCIGIDKIITQNLVRKDKKRIMKLLKKVILALYLIDKLNIDHGELNRPYDHLYICEDKYVKIIDWESSSYRKPHNLTMFMSFLLYRYNRREELMSLLGLNRDQIVKLLKNYKKTLSIKDVYLLIKSLEQP
ncbi:serine/threonine protein kinase [Staphylothermus hellenicus]|uniref:Ser/Thr protein kinase-like protein n=1 Tax=Staphylothermus hellenicus (strain DSM 12710 / JCM 10830 / BK20S6-10-b1 / P8) TaxID=591019 RepID=D7D977_STAHD|nr:serine/threonine protein kinase [Staphylothermus hellenicus]ADI32323.1 Ser/Thr protein kinase-like protein [Staphylothermus hellenicus DSM 12710]